MNEPGWLARRLDHLDGLSGYEKPAHLPGLKLDSNENLAIPETFQREILEAARRRVDVRQYPLGGTDRLVRAISSHLRMPGYMISVGNGSDQILDLILANLAPPGTTILATDPTFSFFVDRCMLYGIRMVRVPYADDMTINMDHLIEKAAGVDMVYLDSPNNPTGHQIPKGGIRRLADSFAGPIILDEAYADFGGYSAYRMVRTVPNLMVVRTLSKSFGMAGLRVGYMVAGRRITEPFSRVVQYPYPLSAVSIESAIMALERADEAAASWDLVRSERRRIIDTLRKYGPFRVFESDANFVLFDAGGADRRIHKALAEQGILVRMLGRIGSASGCMRVSVGTRKMNSRFLLAIRDLMK